jgi:hypothetical protein
MRNRSVEDILWTKFSNTQEFANFLETAASRLGQGDESDMRELWMLFAPTCDWDNAGGSPRVGNLIFSAVEKSVKTSIPHETH